MNSRKTNQKIIDALQGLEPIHDETDDERAERLRIEKETLEKVTKEEPLVFPRRVAGIFCAAVWVFSLVGLMLGFADIGVMLPFMLFALGVYAALNLPVFFSKGKIFDAVICIIAVAACLITAIGMLTLVR